MDGTSRLNNNNILGEGANESEPWRVEDGKINLCHGWNPISSRCCITNAPTITSEVGGGNAIYNGDNLIHEHEGNEWFCNTKTLNRNCKSLMESAIGVLDMTCQCSLRPKASPIYKGKGSSSRYGSKWETGSSYASDGPLYGCFQWRKQNSWGRVNTYTLYC